VIVYKRKHSGCYFFCTTRRAWPCKTADDGPTLPKLLLMRSKEEMKSQGRSKKSQVGMFWIVDLFFVDLFSV
jgi:hypothetical protein